MEFIPKNILLNVVIFTEMILVSNNKQHVTMNGGGQFQRVKAERKHN